MYLQITFASHPSLYLSKTRLSENNGELGVGVAGGRVDGVPSARGLDPGVDNGAGAVEGWKAIAFEAIICLSGPP